MMFGAVDHGAGMSKGWGRIERAIMAELEKTGGRHSRSAADLSAVAFNYPQPYVPDRGFAITASQLRSVKRALKRLEAGEKSQ